MARSRGFSEVDRFLLNRWAEVAEFRRVSNRTRHKVRRLIQSVAGELQPWAAARGFELYPEIKHAEFKAYRPEWKSKSGHPAVVLCLGGFAPHKFERVDCEYPYIAAYLEGFFDGGDKKAMAATRNVAVAFRKQLGAEAAQWEDLTESWGCPALRWLKDTDAGRRVELASREQLLLDFAKEQLGALLPLSDAVSRTLAEEASTVS
jgi:hypothetical protein